MGEAKGPEMRVLPPLDNLSYVQARTLQEEWGGLVIRNPRQREKWCWLMDPRQELSVLRPDLDYLPVSVWVMVGLDEKRLEILMGDDPDRPN